MKKSLLRAHVASEHAQPTDTPTKAYLCDRSGCFKSFDSPSELNYHILAVHDIGCRYICGHPDCQGENVHFDTKKQLRQHTGQVHATLFECEECGRKFTKKCNMRLHHRLKHNDSLKTPLYPCSECDQVFERKSYLKKHEKRIHRRESIVVCIKCGKEFSTRGSLTRHTENVDCTAEATDELLPTADTASPIPDVDIKNRLTGYGYCQKSLDKPYSCPIDGCKYAFGREYDLMRHLRSDMHGKISVVDVQQFEWLCFEEQGVVDR